MIATQIDMLDLFKTLIYDSNHKLSGETPVHHIYRRRKSKLVFPRGPNNSPTGATTFGSYTSTRHAHSRRATQPQTGNDPSPSKKPTFPKFLEPLIQHTPSYHHQ